MQKNEIHICYAQSQDFISTHERLIAVLSSEEYLRADRFIREAHRRNFQVSQGLLRLILADYLGRAPETIVFSRHSHGKPFIEGNPIFFNLSHSNGCVVVAISKAVELGVDVEYLEGDHDFDALIARFFSMDERRAYEAFSQNDRREAFFRAWTRKEAYLKATGLGLSFPLNQFSVSLDSSENHSLISVSGDVAVRSKWTLMTRTLLDNYFVSLAAPLQEVNLITRKWSVSKLA